MDDIVTRLYNLCICCRCGCEQQCTDCEAAAEIERLQAEVLRFMNIAYSLEWGEK